MNVNNNYQWEVAEKERKETINGYHCARFGEVSQL